MARKKQTENSDQTIEFPVCSSEEARQNAMINQAERLAFKQLCDGTASAQVIVHYLKLGSAKDRLEQEILEKQRDLIVAKTESIKDAKITAERYTEAIEAMKMYKGIADDADEKIIL